VSWITTSRTRDPSFFVRYNPDDILIYIHSITTIYIVMYHHHHLLPLFASSFSALLDAYILFKKLLAIFGGNASSWRQKQRRKDYVQKSRYTQHIFTSPPTSICQPVSPPQMSQQLVLRVKRLSPHAVLPFRATLGAAGYDLCRFARTCLSPPPRAASITQCGGPPHLAGGQLSKIVTNSNIKLIPVGAACWRGRPVRRTAWCPDEARRW
jgi:hypothetical protein